MLDLIAFILRMPALLMPIMIYIPRPLHLPDPINASRGGKVIPSPIHTCFLLDFASVSRGIQTILDAFGVEYRLGSPHLVFRQSYENKVPAEEDITFLIDCCAALSRGYIMD
jgi:hypothetical protein